MQFSPNFAQKEFEMDAPIPAECFSIAKIFCLQVLEPIRSIVGGPLEITSGYRPPEANAAAHGVSDSEHIWTPEKIAADFTFNTMFGRLLSVRMVFDRTRASVSIPFHQLILEHGANGSSIIHVSMNLNLVGVRQALEGATHNASAYMKWPVVDFVPQIAEGENA